MQVKKEIKNTTELNNPCTCLKDVCGIDTKLSRSAIHFGKKSHQILTSKTIKCIFKMFC